VKRLVTLAVLVATVAAAGALLEGRRREGRYRQLLLAGEEALRTGDSYGAIEAFSGAIALRPDSMAAHYRKGEAYRAQHRDEEAIRDLLEAVRLAPDAPQPVMALAELYDARGEPAMAAKWYQDADRLKRDDPSLLYSLALARYRAGNPAAAVEPLRRALALNDSTGQAHYLLGVIYRDTGDIASATNALETAVRVAPSMTPAREELADIYRSLGRTADEMAQLQALSAADPSIDRRIALALAEMRNGHANLALATLADAERRAPADSRVLLARGRVNLASAEQHRRRDAIDAALAELERALGGTARRSEGLALYGRALFLAGHDEDAERILREAVSTSPVEPQAFAFLADAAERRGHLLDARDALLDVDALEGGTVPADARAARAARIGQLSLDGLDYRTAADYLNRAVAGRPGDAASHARLAQARWAIGDQPGAVQAITRARALAPNDPVVQRLTRTIK
jgi:tetratricopeptide (TPR) repeat protein